MAAWLKKVIVLGNRHWISFTLAELEERSYFLLSIMLEIEELLSILFVNDVFNLSNACASFCAAYCSRLNILS